MPNSHSSALSALRRTLVSGAAIFGCIGLLACADTEGAEQEFIERDCKAKGVKYDEDGCVKQFQAGACEPPLAGEADGTYQLVVSATVSPGSPLLGLAELTSTAGADGLDLSMELTWLAASDRKTPTSNSQTLTGTVNGEGTLAVSFDIDIDNTANPVLDAPLVAPEVNLAGLFCKDPMAEQANCGAVTGNVTAPAEIDLEGSTFTLYAADAAALPDNPIINCEGTEADPL